MSSTADERKARTAAKQARRTQRERTFADKTLALPGGMYGVVLEDFEWDYETWSEAGRDRHASNHYPTARDAHTAAEIVARTEERFRCAAPSCVLFKWTPVPFLHIAMDVLRLRGFTYKSSIMWDKLVPGTGHWSRNQHEVMLVGARGEVETDNGPELILIGVRGNVPCPAMGQQWRSSIITEKRREHSRKPEQSYQLIESYFPNVPKIELNCRGKPRPGWDAWGNEVREAAE